MQLKARVLGLAILGLLLPGTSASAAVEETTLSSVTPIEGATLTPLAPGTHAFAVAIGPDGNLWFAGSKSNFGPADDKIGRVAPGEGVTEFALPESRFGWQDGIVTALDGNLWFTENEGNRIGRITLAGEITEFPVPGAGSRPNAITAGPDGNLWFTEGGGNRIGRITPAGEITEFPVPGPDGRPNQIVSGPDGNLWFTFEAANKIGRITPFGVVDQFPVPTSTGTEAIVAGPDGNLWFTSRDRLGSISPSGHPGQLSCPNQECHLPLLSLTAGPEGLWFGTWRSVLGYGGGLTEMTQDVSQPGYVGRLMPRTSGTVIDSRARPVAGRRTDLRLSCVDVSGCQGALRLLRRAPGYIRRNSYPTISVLARHRYRLAAGETRRISLYLTREAVRLLVDQGSLSVWATAGSRPDVEAIQLIVLRPRAGHRPAA